MTGLRRRHLVLGAGSSWVLPSRAQTAARPLIGYLGGVRPDAAVRRSMVQPLEDGLRTLGLAPGRQVELVYRWADAQLDRLPGLLAELMALRPNVLVASGPRPGLVIRDAGGSLPTVVVPVDDPVTMGFAASYARPGGRFTGLSGPDGILEKRMQLLKDLLPDARRFGILGNPLTNPLDDIGAALPKWERQLGIGLQLVTVRTPDDLDIAVATLRRQQCDGVVALADAMIYSHRARLGALTLQHRLPTVVGGNGYLDSLGVASYQADFSELFRRAAGSVAKILKGTPPGEIPWEQSTKMELAVNLKTARALGLRVPRSLLVSADEVIE